MSIKPDNRYQNEKSANENVKVVLNKLFAEKHIHPNDVYTVHNIFSGAKDDLNKNGADITTTCKVCGTKINYDMKYAPAIRDNDYDTVMLEIGTYAFDGKEKRWQTGWAYNCMVCQYVVWCVPLDDGWENQQLHNYIMYICKKSKIRELCENILRENEVVDFCENEDTWIKRNKWNGRDYGFMLDDQIQIKMNYEKKTNEPDGVLLITKLKDIMSTGVIVVNDQIIKVTDDYDFIERIQQKERKKYRQRNFQKNAI